MSIKNNLFSKVTSEINSFRKALFLQKSPIISDHLLDKEIMNILDKTPSKRVSIYSAMETIKAFLFQTLSKESSCKHAVIDILTGRLAKGKPANRMNTGAFCKARKRLPLKELNAAACGIGMRLHRNQPEELMWKGHLPVIADGITSLLQDTPENQKEFPQQSNQKPGLGFPIIRMVALISLGVGSIIDYKYARYQGKGTGETSLFSKMIPSFSEGDLFLGDCYYCTFAFVALLSQRKVPVLLPQHANRDTDFSKGERLSRKDHIIEWSKPKIKPVWISREDYDELPETILVREFEVKGRVYVTTLMEHGQYKKKELMSLYEKRWFIELDFRSIKTNMGMEMLSCKTPEMVLKEISVYFLGYNIVRCNIAEAAILNKKNPRHLSFKAAVQVLTLATAYISIISGKKLARILMALLEAIASTPIGKQKRKSMPREVKRRPKAFKLRTN